MTIRNCVQTNLFSIFLLNKLYDMKIEDFFMTYSTEANCKQYFKEQRELAGIVCRQCGSSSHYWIE
jgi:hypothetical protein